tara:strand:- start:1088 stop:2227 length:1140 start_codon:yes stop_codon:yes gene_type:complete
MASTLFGMPNGFLAADENNRQNQQAGLLAMKTLGEIEQQPAHLDLMKAQTVNTQAMTRLHTADAAQKEAAAAELLRMKQIEADWQKLEQARRAAIDQAKLEGKTLTVGDVPPGGFGAPAAAAETQSAYMLRQAEELSRRGAPLAVTNKIRDDAVKLAKDEAQTQSAQAETNVRQIEGSRKLAVDLGSLAEYALRGPQQYAEARMAAVARGLPLDKLPANFEQAAPLLRGMVAQATTAKEKADIETARINAAAAASRAGAAHVTAAATASVAKERVELYRTRNEILRKTGGEAADAAVDSKRATTEAKRVATEAKRAQVFPNIPLDPKEVRVGQAYTLANGQLGRAVADPNGQVVGRDGKRFSLVPVKPGAMMSAEGDDE